MAWCDALSVNFCRESTSLGGKGGGAASLESLSASIKIESIGCLGILANLIKLPFEQVVDIGKSKLPVKHGRSSPLFADGECIGPAHKACHKI